MCSAGSFQLVTSIRPLWVGTIALCGRLFFMFFLLLPCLPAGAQANALSDPGQGVEAIPGLWQFHTGDSLSWAAPGFNDAGWQALGADAPWGVQGHAGYTGFAWYRKHITVQAAEPLGLMVPRTYGAYEVFWDGRQIGSSGVLPPRARWYLFGKEAVFALPAANGTVDGELCLRFWAPPAGASADPAEGGLEGTPRVGSLPLLEQQLQLLTLRTEHRTLPNTVVATLMCAGGLLSLLLFLWRGRDVAFLGLALLLLGVAVESTQGNLHRTLFFTTDQLLTQACTVARDVGLWLVLLWAFGLKQSRRWRVATGVVTAVYLLAQAMDCVAIVAWQHAGSGLVRTDAVSTQLYLVLELYAVVLAAWGWARRRRWSLAPLAVVAMLFGIYPMLANNAVMTRFKVAQAVLGWSVQIREYRFNAFTLLGWLLVAMLVVLVALRQWREARRQAHLEQEMLSAQELQQVLIPEAVPRVDGLAVTSVYKPAAEVGGDFIQVIAPDPEAPEAGTLIVVGDVSGKGLKAAMTVSLIVGTLRTLADASRSPAVILAGLNRRLLGRTHGGFATCVVLRLDADGTATLANAGHLSPFRDGEEWAVPASLPLGLVPEVDFDEVRTHLHAGETLTFLTDGVLEARNSRGDLYGFERVANLMRTRPGAEEIAEAARAFGQEDDISVVTVTRTGTRERASLHALQATTVAG